MNKYLEKYSIILAKKYVAIPIIAIMIFGGIGGIITFSLEVIGIIDICMLDQYIFGSLKLDVICDEKFLNNNIIVTFAYGGMSWIGFWQGRLFYRGMKAGKFQV